MTIAHERQKKIAMPKTAINETIIEFSAEPKSCAKYSRIAVDVNSPASGKRTSKTAKAPEYTQNADIIFLRASVIIADMPVNMYAAIKRPKITFAIMSSPFVKFTNSPSPHNFDYVVNVRPSAYVIYKENTNFT